MEAADDLFKRAMAGCVEAQWEHNLHLDVTTETQCTKADNGLVEVPLRKLVERTILPNIPRSMSLVDKRLQDCFRGLVTGKQPWPLYLHGPAGVGKTRAVLALCDFIRGAVYTTLRECCDAKMSNGHDVWGGTFWETLPLFVLDEIGCRLKAGDLEYTCIIEAWEARERDAAGVAIYVSNLTPGDLNAMYDNRVASRLLCGTVFKLDGPDRRLQRKHEGPASRLPEKKRPLGGIESDADYGREY